MPRNTHTHTFAKLEVTAAAYDEIAGKLREAGYDHVFIDDAIDMHGIGLTRMPETASEREKFPLSLEERADLQRQIRATGTITYDSARGGYFARATIDGVIVRVEITAREVVDFVLKDQVFAYTSDRLIDAFRTRQA